MNLSAFFSEIQYDLDNFTPYLRRFLLVIAPVLIGALFSMNISISGGLSKEDAQWLNLIRKFIMISFYFSIFSVFFSFANNFFIFRHNKSTDPARFVLITIEIFIFLTTISFFCVLFFGINVYFSDILNNIEKGRPMYSPSIETKWMEENVEYIIISIIAPPFLLIFLCFLSYVGHQVFVRYRKKHKHEWPLTITLLGSCLLLFVSAQIRPSENTVNFWYFSLIPVNLKHIGMAISIVLALSSLAIKRGMDISAKVKSNPNLHIIKNCKELF